MDEYNEDSDNFNSSMEEEYQSAISFSAGLASELTLDFSEMSIDGKKYTKRFYEEIRLTGDHSMSIKKSRFKALVRTTKYVCKERKQCTAV